MNLVADLARDDVVSGLRQLETKLGARGVTRLAIFGSRARRDNQPESDLDILIDVERGRKFSLLDSVGVAHVIEDSLGVSADMFMRRSLEARMFATIQPDIIEIF